VEKIETFNRFFPESFLKFEASMIRFRDIDIPQNLFPLFGGLSRLKVNKFRRLTGAVGREKPRPLQRRPPLRDVPKPDAVAAAVRDADETVAEAPDGDADGKLRERPNADDAAAAAVAATRMPPDDKRPPSPASCRRPLSPRRRRRLLLLLKPTVAPQSYHPPLPGSR